jgi:hypothetical protein
MSTRSRQRKQGKARSSGGALRGLRSGFKKAVGRDPGGDTVAKGSLRGTILTVLILLAAIGFFLYRQG